MLDNIFNPTPTLTPESESVIHSNQLDSLTAELGELLGYAIVKLGGTLIAPPRPELFATLKAHGGSLKRAANPDGSITLTIEPYTGETPDPVS